MTKIYLIRHGETEWNKRRLQQGHSDIELNHEGLRQSADTSRLLAGIRLSAIYSSDMKRASQTAEIIGREQGLQVVKEPGFREINEGDWEGLSQEQIAQRWPKIWKKRGVLARPGGEAPMAVRDRALQAISRIVERHPGEGVAVIAHQGVIGWILNPFTESEESESRAFDRLRNGEVVVVDACLEAGSLRLGSPTLLSLQEEREGGSKITQHGADRLPPL